MKIKKRKEIYFNAKHAPEKKLQLRNEKFIDDRIRRQICL